MEMKIPKTFYILGKKYNIEMYDDLFEKDGVYGDVDPDLKLIRLQKVGKVGCMEESGNEYIKYVDDDDVLETWLHELVHLILSCMGEDKLYRNEQFVSLFSGMLYQIIKSSKYQ
jgi:hypothetical protein